MNGPLRNDVEQAIAKLENAEEHAEEAGLDLVAEQLGEARRTAIMAHDEIGGA